MSTITNFQTTLNRFNESLPDRLKLSEVNVEAHLNSRERPSYIMLHTWVCLTHIDLYRFSMPSLKDQTIPESPYSIPYEFLRRCQNQVVAYACSLAQFWIYSLEMIQSHKATVVSKGLVTIDWMIGACVVDVTTILLTARKHPVLYRNLRDGSSAQLCRSREVDDSFLATMISGMINVLDVAKPYLPRIESYVCLQAWPPELLVLIQGLSSNNNASAWSNSSTRKELWLPPYKMKHSPQRPYQDFKTCWWKGTSTGCRIPRSNLEKGHS